MSVPRPEYPRPQLRRAAWLNLNGTWTYTFDHGRSGMDPGRDLQLSEGFEDSITVPFCPESECSGVASLDFVEAMWYHRRISIPAAWTGQHILLHFGAVDYESEVFVDGRSAGIHFGGSASFSFDITALVKPGSEHHLVVRVLDETRSGTQPGGKQSPRYRSHGCLYTRTTGIWQTVWLEAVHACGVQSVQILPDLDGGRLTVVPRYHGTRQGVTLTVTLRDADAAVATTTVTAAQGVPAVLSVPEPRPWSPADPHLYDLDLEVRGTDGGVLDAVESYAGLRKIHVQGDRLFLNNRPIYLRLVLDQGFYPDGIWTAPSDAALKRDIELAMRAGFNGARLHQKVFEERFHYWADRLGYLTWGESASWGCDINTIAGARNFASEWAEILVRDRNHPSIIAWTPFNETGRVTNAKQHHRLTHDMAELCRRLDPTRPVNDTSGYVHVDTDLWTVHNYTQDPEELRRVLTPSDDHGVFRNVPDAEPAYGGQPYLVDEFGGIKWIPPQKRPFADDSWGYGDAPETLEKFHRRLAGQVEILLALRHVCGYCYTQLTDVEQEQNGIYSYDRSEKFDMARIAAVFSQRPADWPGL